MHLAAGQHEVEGVTQAVRDGVNLGTEPASRAAQRLDLGAAFRRTGRARMTVESIRMFCKSGGCEQPVCNACQTPWRHQRENRLKTEFHWPSSAGNKRHCAPDRSTHKTATRKARQAVSDAMRTRGWVASMG